MDKKLYSLNLDLDDMVCITVCLATMVEASEDCPAGDIPLHTFIEVEHQLRAQGIDLADATAEQTARVNNRRTKQTGT